MKNDIIKEIWEIRGMLDEAIDNHDIDLFNKARDRFNIVFKSEKYLLTISTSTIDYEPVDVEDMRKDREQNFAIIAFDLGFNLRRVQGEELDVKKFQFSSILELIWWTRWMFDNFIKNANNDVSYDVNVLSYNAIKSNLREMINYYGNFDDKVSRKEMETLKELSHFVEMKHNELYVNDENKID